MAETFRMAVERLKVELLQQVKPGTGRVALYLSTNHSKKEARAAGEEAGEIMEMLQGPINLHFCDEINQGR